MKKKRFLWLIAAVLLLVGLCAPEPAGSFPTSQERERIVSVELLYDPEGEHELRFQPVCRIEADRWEVFLDELQELEARRYFNDPATNGDMP